MAPQSLFLHSQARLKKLKRGVQAGDSPFLVRHKVAQSFRANYRTWSVRPPSGGLGTSPGIHPRRPKPTSGPLEIRREQPTRRVPQAFGDAPGVDFFKGKLLGALEDLAYMEVEGLDEDGVIDLYVELEVEA